MLRAVTHNSEAVQKLKVCFPGRPRGSTGCNTTEARLPYEHEDETARPQPTAFFTSAVIFASSLAVSSSSA